MARQELSIGSSPNDGNGDTLRSGAVKINENFIELYNQLGIGEGEVTFVNSLVAGNGISLSADTGNIVITNSKPALDSYNSFIVSGQDTLAATSSSHALTVVAGSNVVLTTNALSNTLTIAATQQPADWDAVSGPTSISNKPTIPDAQIQSDYTQTDTGAVDFIKNKPVIFYDINEMADTEGRLPGLRNDYRYNTTTDTLLPGETKVIATSFMPNIIGMRLTIEVGGPDIDDNVNFQIAEMTVVKSSPVVLLDEFGQPIPPAPPIVHSVVYGVIYTAPSVMATFTSQWNNLTERVEIVATNTSSDPFAQLITKVIAYEMLAA
jgi:hypothetical protein